MRLLRVWKPDTIRLSRPVARIGESQKVAKRKDLSRHRCAIQAKECNQGDRKKSSMDVRFDNVTGQCGNCERSRSLSRSLSRSTPSSWPSFRTNCQAASNKQRAPRSWTRFWGEIPWNSRKWYIDNILIRCASTDAFSTSLHKKERSGHLSGQ